MYASVHSIRISCLVRGVFRRPLSVGQCPMDILSLLVLWYLIVLLIVWTKKHYGFLCVRRSLTHYFIRIVRNVAVFMLANLSFCVIACARNGCHIPFFYPRPIRMNRSCFLGVFIEISSHQPTNTRTPVHSEPVVGLLNGSIIAVATYAHNAPTT